MRVLATALTHIGAVRAHNEDTVAVGDWIESGSMVEPASFELEVVHPLICLVADGMGGHAAGEVASRSAAEYLVSQAARATDEDALARLLREANVELFELMRERPGLAGMGTTAAGLAIGEKVIVFNVGDSRVYRIERDRLIQLSTDDTPGPKLENGRTAAFTSSLITQTLGGAAMPMDIEPHTLAEPCAPGARYLLASDGLTDLVDVTEIGSILQQDNADTTRALFEAAMARGGRDNISIVMVEIEPGGA